MHSHRSAEAVELYKQAVCLVPNSARGLYGLGVAEAAAGDFRQARESLQAADRMQPNTPMPLAMQARVNVSLHDLDALKKNLLEAAVRFPNDAGVHESMARFLAEKNLLVLALAEALRAEQAGGRNVNTTVQLAGLENAAGAYSDAIRKALSAEQDADSAREIRASAAGIAGLSYESLGEKEPAVEQLRQAIQFDPRQDTSYLALADLFDQLQRYDEAVLILRQGRDKSPSRKRSFSL